MGDIISKTMSASYSLTIVECSLKKQIDIVSSEKKKNATIICLCHISELRHEWLSLMKLEQRGLIPTVDIA